MSTHHSTQTLTATEEAAWLNAPDRPISFTERCATARATIYAEQRKRNERFEHLRRLLCKEPEAPITVTHETGGREDDGLLREGASPRCTCCRVESHRPWVFLGYDERGKKVWGAGDPDELRAAREECREVEQCKDCLHDREDSCPATLHWRTLPTPDSATVRPPHPDPEQNAAKHAALLHDGWECCEAVEAREPEAPAIAEQRELSAKVSKLTGIRDLDAVRTYHSPRHALVAVNPLTRYVTVQYGARQNCRLSMNSSTLTLKLEWTDAEGVRRTQKVDRDSTGKRYETLDELEAARDRAAEWLLETWKADERTDIQQAKTTQYSSVEEMWAKVRMIRDLLDARGIEARVWNTTRKGEGVAA